MRDGKVYVSLENSLLFAPGSWSVAANGQVALENLARVLADNEEISILVGDIRTMIRTVDRAR